MKTGYNSRGKVLLITVSILLLLVPDILFSSQLNFLSFITIVSRACLLLFFGVLLLAITKSYFVSYLLLGIPYLLSAIPESINVLVLNVFMNSDDLKAIYYTSPSEVVEFWGKFRIYFIIPLILIVSYIIVLVKFKNRSFYVLSWRRTIPLALVMLSVSIGISVYRMSLTMEYFTEENIAKMVFKRCYMKEPPLNIYYRICRHYVINKRNNEYKIQKDKFSFQVQKDTNAIPPKTVVFIIGEAMRYNSWSINGYERETSPRLKTIENLISYTNHYSNGNCTSNSIPLLITQATPHTFQRAYSQKTIVSLFKEAGYKTGWISSTVDVLNYLDNHNEPHYLCNLRQCYEEHTDRGIVPALDSVLNNDQLPQFIVINMRGGHDRPPVPFNVFKPNSCLKYYPYKFENREIFVNDYDNMILFQDYVLSNVINTLKSKQTSAVLLFTSDHATHLFDSDDHALFGYGSSHPTEIETHIPLFVWCSGDYITSNQDKFNNLKRHKNSLSTNDNLFYTLADMAHIKYDSFIKSRSLADSSFIEPHSRFVYTNSGVFEFKKELY